MRLRTDTKSQVRYRAHSESQPYGQSVDFSVSLLHVVIINPFMIE